MGREGEGGEGGAVADGARPTFGGAFELRTFRSPFAAPYTISTASVSSDELWSVYEKACFSNFLAVVNCVFDLP